MFTLAEAAELMPGVRARADEIIRLRADLAELTFELGNDGFSRLGGRAEAKSCEAQLDDLLTWFANQGIQLKGIAPLLLDFPAMLHGRYILFCWLEGEPELAWYHRAELGFAARRPLPRLS